MIRSKVYLGAGLLALAFLGGACLAQKQDKSDNDETVGQSIDRAVDDLKRGAKEAKETIKEQYDKAKKSVRNLGVSGRVYSRLHWDKALHDIDIDIDVRDDGVTTLRGKVPDVLKKSKAVSVAEETVGVSRVVDELKVDENASAASRASDKSSSR